MERKVLTFSRLGITIGVREDLKMKIKEYVFREVMKRTGLLVDSIDFICGVAYCHEIGKKDRVVYCLNCLGR